MATSNVTTAAETNVIKTTQMVKVREVDFVRRFTGTILKKLMEALGVTRKIPMIEGTTMYYYTTTGTLQDGAVPEGEIIPLSQYQRNKIPIGEISLKKWRKAATAEAILKSGYDEAVIETDRKLLTDVQTGIRTNFFTTLKGVQGTEVTGSNLQKVLANAWGSLQVLFENDAIEAVHFMHPLTIADYLGSANITIQTAFGLNYISDFLGLGTVIMTSQIPQGEVYSTAKENLIMYYVPVSAAAMASLGVTADETGYIGIKSGYPTEERAQVESLVLCGIEFLVEYAYGVVKGTIDDSFLTDLTMSADAADATYPWTDKKPADFQSNIAVSNGEVTGTLKFIEGGLSPSGPLAGDGYFLAVKFDNFSSGLTYANVQVGLSPSASGMALQTLDSDKNAVFKIRDLNQKIKAVQTDAAGHKNIQYFALDQLVLEPQGA